MFQTIGCEKRKQDMLPAPLVLSFPRGPLLLNGTSGTTELRPLLFMFAAGSKVRGTDLGDGHDLCSFLPSIAQLMIRTRLA